MKEAIKLKIIDNVNQTLKEDLATEIHKGSKISIVAACFYIYAFSELKKELKNIEELRFIFILPIFIEVAEKKTYYVVFRDSSMANDSVVTNFDQIFASISSETVRKVL